MDMRFCVDGLVGCLRCARGNQSIKGLAGAEVCASSVLEVYSRCSDHSGVVQFKHHIVIQGRTEGVGMAIDS